MSTIIEKAQLVATVAHGATGQKRKHSGIAYINHPADVVKILTENSPGVTRKMLAAAWLHDVVEDTGVTIDFIQQEFGIAVARMVFGLTNSKLAIGNREERHHNNLLRLSKTANDVKTIKLADSIANLRDIIREDPKFAIVYVTEKRKLLDEALIGGCSTLWDMADKIIKDFER